MDLDFKLTIKKIVLYFHFTRLASNTIFGEIDTTVMEKNDYF